MTQPLYKKGDLVMFTPPLYSTYLPAVGLVLSDQLHEDGFVDFLEDYAPDSPRRRRTRVELGAAWEKIA